MRMKRSSVGRRDVVMRCGIMKSMGARRKRYNMSEIVVFYLIYRFQETPLEGERWMNMKRRTERAR